MPVTESVPLVSIASSADYTQLNPVNKPKSGFCSGLSNCAGKTWNVVKNAPGAIAGVVGAAVGVPLIVEGAKMIKTSFESGPGGWTAWYEDFNSNCTAHLGGAAFN